MTAATGNPDRKAMFLVFTGDTQEQAAVNRFKNKYGLAPELIYHFNGQVWVGPVPKEKRPG